MRRKLNEKRVLSIRYGYLLYVYEKYVYTVFEKKNMTLKEKLRAGMVKHNENPEILEQYMKNTKMNEEEKNIFLKWKNELYGPMFLLGVNKGKVCVYFKNTDQIYIAQLPIEEEEKNIKLVPNYVPTYASLYEIYDKLYIETILKPDDTHYSFKELENLYEHIYELASCHPQKFYPYTLYTYRSLNANKINQIVLDFVGLMSPLTMVPADVDKLVEVATLAWNSCLTKYVDTSHIENYDIFHLFVERKKKYFSGVNEVIGYYEVRPLKKGFQLHVQSFPVDEFNRHQEEGGFF